MKHTKKVFLVIFSFLSLSIWADWELPPAARTLEEQIKYLLAIRAEIPSLVENGSEYDVDPFNIFEITYQFGRELVAQPEFNHTTSTRKHFHTIRAQYVRPQVVNHFVIHPSVIEQARVDGNSRRLRSTRFVNALKSWATYDGRAILTGLATLQPDAIKRIIFRSQDISEKIQALKDNPISAEKLNSAFRFSEHRIPEELRSYNHLVAIIEEFFESEEKVWSAVLASFSTEQDLGTLTSDQVMERLAEMGAGFEELSHYENRFRSAFESRFFSKVRAEIPVLEEEITLREVPGSLAAFRGIVGSDCSTSVSCAIGLLPMEYTFFIYDAAGVLRGYIAGTKLRVEREDNGETHDAFYLHDFAGPRLSARTTTLAIAALQHELPKLGMDRITVPESEQMTANMNYKTISDAVEALVDENVVYSNSYLDHRLRSSLMSLQRAIYIDWSYDTPEANPVSRGIDTQKLRLGDLKVETSVARAGELRLNTVRLDDVEAKLLILDLLSPEAMQSAREATSAAVAEVRAAGYTVNQVDYSMRTQAAMTVAQQFQIMISPLQSVVRELQNPSEMSLADYYRNSARILTGVGITEFESVVEAHPHFFFEGHLRAPDRLSVADPKMKARTIEYTIAVLRRWPGSSIAWGGVMANPEPFQKSARFQNYIRSLLVAPETHLEAFPKLISVGFDFSFLDTDRDRGAIELRRSNLKSTTIKRALGKIIQQFCESRVTGEAS